MLTLRRAEILGLVVDEYIGTAAPVSSRALVTRHGLAFSPATIRNELARLEEDGYITHPYTSAGRVPSNLGYRLYVEELMAELPVGPDEQRTIEHQFHQAPAGLEEWLSLAASILAAAVGNVAIITRPRAAAPTLRQVQMVQISGETVLLVAVMDDSRVQQRLLVLTEPEGQAGLTARSARLNERCSGRTASEVRALAEGAGDPLDERTLTVLAEVIESHRSEADIYIEGVRAALAQPEFASAERMLEAVRHLEQYELQHVLPPTEEMEIGAAHVAIGDENRFGWLQEWSVVASAYGDERGLRGAVAVLGPTRMRYDRTVPRVRYVARLMGSLLQGVRQ